MANKKNLSADQRDRLNSLINTVTLMDDMEKSSQMYSVNNIGGDKGNVTLEGGNVISINYTGRTANFVHELTHAGQFECDNEAFSTETGMSVTNDVFDEVAAYKAQYAYSPSSVYNLTSTANVKGKFSYANITDKWVRGITDLSGNRLYDRGGRTNSGQIPLNVFSTFENFRDSEKRGVTKRVFPLYGNPYVYYKK